MTWRHLCPPFTCVCVCVCVCMVLPGGHKCPPSLQHVSLCNKIYHYSSISFSLSLRERARERENDHTHTTARARVHTHTHTHVHASPTVSHITTGLSSVASRGPHEIPGIISGREEAQILNSLLDIVTI
jgi:hypothetical protein